VLSDAALSSPYRHHISLAPLSRPRDGSHKPFTFASYRGYHSPRTFHCFLSSAPSLFLTATVSVNANCTTLSTLMPPQRLCACQPEAIFVISAPFAQTLASFDLCTVLPQFPPARSMPSQTPADHDAHKSHIEISTNPTDARQNENNCCSLFLPPTTSGGVTAHWTSTLMSFQRS
jgi:hypothetical protein